MLTRIPTSNRTRVPALPATPRSRHPEPFLRTRRARRHLRIRSPAPSWTGEVRARLTRRAFPPPAGFSQAHLPSAISQVYFLGCGEPPLMVPISRPSSSSPWRARCCGGVSKSGAQAQRIPRATSSSMGMKPMEMAATRTSPTWSSGSPRPAASLPRIAARARAVDPARSAFPTWSAVPLPGRI